MGRRKDEVEEIRIKDWELVEDVKDEVFSLEVFAVCRIYSEVDAEECRKLLRAIVSIWINQDIAKTGTTKETAEDWKRERALRINRIPKDRWSWGFALQPIATQYQASKKRPKHRAALVIMGNIWRFESELQNSHII